MIKTRKMLIILSLISFGVSITAPAAYALNIVDNGSFEFGSFTNDGFNYMRVDPGETSLLNWTVVNEAVAWGVSPTDGFSASDGLGFVDLSSFGAQSSTSQLQQTLDTVPGTQYLFSIDRQGGVSDIFIDGAALILTSGEKFGDWTTYTSIFTATDTSSLLSINNAAPGNQIVFLDNVSVTTIASIPEPGVMLLLATGLIGLIVYNINREKHMTEAKGRIPKIKN